MIYIHDLDGCAPTPLAHYLKALGILRLVAEQADPYARGWWAGERFRLATTLDREALERFFLNSYQPTPLIAPWNKGSGFFYHNDPALTPLAEAKAPRFDRYRQAISATQRLLVDMVAADNLVRAIKGETKQKSLSKTQRETLKRSPEYKKRLAEAEREFKMAKADLIPHCRLAWRGPHRAWMDAAMVLDDNGTPRFPALLGTGGNDGRLDFTNNFMQRLGDVFDLGSGDGRPRPDSPTLLRAALWGDTTIGYQAGASVGQYLPGAAGGANNSNGPTADSLLNPFDFLLMLEGSVSFSASATRRMGVMTHARAAAPFAVNAHGAGYASAGDTDESARGEQWMPLWNHPLTWAELRHMLAEGRAQIGARTVREPLDLARAVARLGVARGIPAFQRYGYIERNGQSNLAVPLGRFRVPDHVEPKLACLDDLDAWLPRLRREARGKYATARFARAERVLSDALFAVIRHADVDEYWQAVLLALTSVEAIQVAGNGVRAGPIPPLRPEWVGAADDGSPEFRLALALALQKWRRRPSEGASPILPDTVRRHWLPLKGSRFAVNSEGRLQLTPDIVISARDGVSDAIALVSRRLIEAEQRGEHRLPLVSGKSAWAYSSDLAALVAGQVNLDRTLALARALMAIDRDAWADQPSALTKPHAHPTWPDDAWLTVRLAVLPWPLKDGPEIGADPAIIRRLAAGDAQTAVTLALRRLRAAGIATTVRSATASPETARLWAAAMAFPITRHTAQQFVHRLDPNPERESRS